MCTEPMRRVFLPWSLGDLGNRKALIRDETTRRTTDTGEAPPASGRHLDPELMKGKIYLL